VEAGRRLYARSYVASNDGNISARLDDRRLITTPKGVCKGFMTPDMMVVVDFSGKKVSGDVTRTADAHRDLSSAS
jgi:L-fuculose-phosphate aldolase